MSSTLTRLAVGACTTVAVVIGAPGVALASTAPASVEPGTYTTDSVDSFTWVSGNQSWAGPAKDRLLGTTFRVSGSTFVMAQPGGYPTLRGSIDSDGRFHAASHTSSGVGSTDTEVEGELDGDDLTLTYTAGAVTAAVVNGTAYGENRTKAFQAELTVTSS